MGPQDPQSHDLGPESQSHIQIDNAPLSYAHDTHSLAELARITFVHGSLSADPSTGRTMPSIIPCSDEPSRSRAAV